MHFLQSGHISSLSTSSPQAGHSFMTMCVSPLRFISAKMRKEVYKFILFIGFPYTYIFPLLHCIPYTLYKADNAKEQLIYRLHSRT